ncbi:hypothetical protein K227x_41500 [Rubripirellula lacrimiformis]|uniref:DUF2523 domain-containing protein n=1 Tax=Rubripirellula lacrimiformis TaxID=1930273 RepID=A0A517NF38_9BACT|nr:hypothetical protein [Rubripirellula lacrimiformis]QDT05747.1 hypothetical protein K227x_41500 [Rubripirellula lacrimiformis]
MSMRAVKWLFVLLMTKWLLLFVIAGPIADGLGQELAENPAAAKAILGAFIASFVKWNVLIDTVASSVCLLVAQKQLVQAKESA